MSGKLYTLISFLTVFWFFCLYTGFRNQKKIVTPVDFFIFGRQLPSWSYFAIITSLLFSGLIFFFHPSLIFLNGLPFSVTSLFVITIPLVGVIFSKRQWILSKRYGYLTPSEMVSDYFKSNILRILIVIIALGFSIPFIAMQLSLGGLLLNIISDNVIGKGSASILIGAVVCVYLSAGGIRSLIIIDSIQFLLIIFGIFCVGFIAYDLVGGWSLLNESMSRIAGIKENLFNIKENYSSYLSIPGTIKSVNLLNDELPYNGIWTSSMILTFVLALSGIQLDIVPIIFYLGAIFWTLGYDTIYGFQDIKDDEIIGVKSTSIKFKGTAKIFLILCYSSFISSLIVGGLVMNFNLIYFLLIAIPVMHLFFYQINNLNSKNPTSCLRIFKSNNYLGIIIFLNILVGRLF